jgi:hypothetical protein
MIMDNEFKSLEELLSKEVGFLVTNTVLLLFLRTWIIPASLYKDENVSLVARNLQI